MLGVLSDTCWPLFLKYCHICLHDLLLFFFQISFTDCFVKSVSYIYLNSFWVIISKSHENLLLKIILKNLSVDNRIRFWFKVFRELKTTKMKYIFYQITWSHLVLVYKKENCFTKAYQITINYACYSFSWM